METRQQKARRFHDIREKRRKRMVRLGAAAQMMTLLDSLLAFVRDAVTADGPVMTEIRVRTDIEEIPVLHLWATYGEETPITRIRQLRAQLDVANAARTLARSGGADADV